DKEQGIFSNSQDGRTSTRANLSLQPSDKVDFTVNLGYTRIKTAFPMTDNGPTFLEAAWTFEPGRKPQPGRPSSHPYTDPALYEQYVNKRYENTIAQGTGFITTAATNVGSATTRYSWDEFTQVKSLGFFVQELVTWRDRLYLTGAVREDNSSVFGSHINRLYYPKLSAAYVISEEPFMRKYAWLD